MRQPMPGVASPVRWTNCLQTSRPEQPPLIGLVRGEGVGPEVIAAALEVLSAITDSDTLTIEACEDVEVGKRAEKKSGRALPDTVINFCEGIFARGGAILHGPAGGRFVYDLRRQFDLFFKISPLQWTYQVQAFHPRSDEGRKLDMLIARENSGGIYQGSWQDEDDKPGNRLARHNFTYTEDQVRRFIQAAARLAKGRRGDLTVVWKESGIPSISRLWQACADEAAKQHGIQYRMVDIDLMAYRLIREPQIFDVIAAPNLFGDILADLGAALLGSRGSSFSGNYDEAGNAVYQTNHGAAFDLADTDRANPAGQMFSLAMLLRESLGLHREAAIMEEAVRSVWAEGWRTDDVPMPGTPTIGTKEMASRVAQRAGEIMESRDRPAGESIGNAAAARPS
jgi:3-isopropylmalate dehydrogenase